MIRPALAQLPGTGDALGNVGGALAGGTGDAAQGVSGSIGQDRAEGRVALGHAADRGFQVVQFRVGGTVNGTQAEFHTQIQEQLVAA